MENPVIHKSEEQSSFLVTIVSIAITLCTSLLFIRSNIVGFTWKSLFSPFDKVPKMLIASFYDFKFVAIMTLPFLVLLQLARNKVRIQRAICIVYSLSSLFVLIVSLANIRIVEILGRPFNYQWFYYSDFLKSIDARQAIRYALSWKLILIAVIVLIGMVVSSFVLKRFISFVLRNHISWKSMLIFIVLLCLLYFPFSRWYLMKKKWDYFKLQNPVVSFLESVADYDTPKLFTMNTTVGPEDFLVTAESFSNKKLRRTDTGIQNILIYVLDGVSTVYLDIYSGAYPVTPVLNKYRQQSMLFKNIYAHVPATNKSLVSILSSVYPLISFYSLTKEYPDARLSSLSSELKKRGHRTAFFNSSDLRFQGGDKFLGHRQFDVIQDYRTRHCDRPVFVGSTEKWPYLDGSDDECTADSLIEWISEAPDQPFFAMLWTMMTHHPYFVSGKEIDFGVKNKPFNRYLNAIHHGDNALGKVLRVLEEKGLIESTLVVVVSDHGEAFGQHDGQYAHGTIYEEVVHVPLIMINRQLFNGEENPEIGGLIDLAPSVMDLLHLPMPENWQGRSLFSGDRTQKVYFFAPWSDHIFGFRENDFKFIFNATRNNYEVYNLLEDPYETENLINLFHSEIVMIQHRLASWVQYQDKLLKNLISLQ
jgi:arylsulfatase A-like enzyme